MAIDNNPNPLVDYKILLARKQENTLSAIMSSSEHPRGHEIAARASTHRIMRLMCERHPRWFKSWGSHPVFSPLSQDGLWWLIDGVYGNTFMNREGVSHFYIKHPLYSKMLDQKIDVAGVYRAPGKVVQVYH